MVNEKGLSEEAADQIGVYVGMQGEILNMHNTAVGNWVLLSKATLHLWTAYMASKWRVLPAAELQHEKMVWSTRELSWVLVNVSVGGMDLAERLLQDQKMCQSKQACAGLTDIKLLFSYLQLFQVTDKVWHVFSSFANLIIVF